MAAAITRRVAEPRHEPARGRPPSSGVAAAGPSRRRRRCMGNILEAFINFLSLVPLTRLAWAALLADLLPFVNYGFVSIKVRM